MVIKEKGLLRLMKEAWKGSGYTVMVADGGDEYLYMSYWGWKVGIRMDAVPRKVLGLLAEHIGKIPVCGEAFKVQKNSVQTELVEMIGGTLQDLLQCIAYWDTHKIMKRTKLEWDGCQIWQSPRDQSIVLMDPELGGIACFSDASMDVRLEGTQLMIRGNRSFAAVGKGFVNDGDKPLLEHLTDVKWTE